MESAMTNIRGTLGLYIALFMILAALVPCLAQNRNATNGSASQSSSINDQVKFLGRFTGHFGAVNCVAFSPDGKTAVSGGDDNAVRLWDLRTFKQIQVFTEPFGAVKGVCISPDGRFLACAALDHRARVWDLATGKQIYAIDCGIEAQTVAISPDSNWLAVGTYSGSRVWNLNTGQELTAYRHDDMGDYAVAWSPDGNYLAGGGYQSQVRIWSMPQQRFIQTFRLNGAQIHAMAITPDGRYLICGTDQGDLIQCDAVTGQQVRVFNGQGGLIYVKGVAITPDGSEMLSSQDDKTVRIWSLSTGQELDVLNGHTLGVSAVAVSADGRFALSGSADGTAALWQLPKGSIIPNQQTVSSSPSKVTTLQVPQSNGNIEPAANVSVQAITPPPQGLTPGDILVSSGNQSNPSNMLYEYTTTGELVRQFPINSPVGVDANLRGVTLSADGNVQIYDGTSNPTLATLDPRTGKTVFHQGAGFDSANSIYFGGVASAGHYVFVTQMTYGDITTSGILRFNTVDFSSQFFSTNVDYDQLNMGRNGLLYALKDPNNGSSDVDIYDPQTMTLLGTVTLKTSGTDIRSIAVSAYGDIFGGGQDGRIYHYNKNGQFQNTIAGAIGPINNLNISPTGQLVDSNWGYVGVIDEASNTSSAFKISNAGPLFVAFVAPPPAMRQLPKGFLVNNNSIPFSATKAQNNGNSESANNLSAQVITSPQGLTPGNILISAGGDSQPPNVLYEYTTKGVLVKQFPIKSPLGVDAGLRSVTLSADGNVQIYDGDSNPTLATLDPRTGKTVFHQGAGFDSTGNAVAGGIASIGRFVFVTQMSYGNTPRGILRFNNFDFSSHFFPSNVDYIQLSMGRNGLLYAIKDPGSGSPGVDIYNPQTMTHLGTVNFPADNSYLRTAAISASGDIFAGGMDGHIYHYNKNGQFVDTIAGAIGQIFSLNISPTGQLVDSNSGLVGIIDITSGNSTVFKIPNVGIIFVAFVAPPPPMQQVSDGYLINNNAPSPANTVQNNDQPIDDNTPADDDQTTDDNTPIPLTTNVPLAIVTPNAKGLRNPYAVDPYSIFRPQYQTTQKNFEKIQAEIQGLVVTPLDDGDMVGQSMDIIATVMAPTQNDANADLATFDNPVGDEMQESLKDAVQAVRLRYPHWQNAVVHITFGDEYSSKDGGSAGGAFAILLLSTLENFTIDDNFAMTGEITIDWKLRPIGGVAAKIQGAIDGGCKAVIVPQTNLQQIQDAMLLDGPDTAWKIQIFTEPNLQHAEEVIRTDRPKNLQQAMDLFAVIQDEFQNKGDNAFHDPEVISELKQVLALDPDLESAQYLLLESQGKQPTKLSEAASIYEAFIDVYPVLDNLLNDNDSINRANLPFQLINKMRQNLANLRGISSENTLSLIDGLTAFVNICDGVVSGDTTPQALDNQRSAVMGELESLQMDHDLMQKMLKEGI
jgi:WD40 repeat protein